NSEKLLCGRVAIAAIVLPPDITNATKAGVLGVILGWQGISNGNAEGQYNPFTVPYSSSPASSQAGSNPSQTTGGIPALWVTEDVGTLIRAPRKKALARPAQIRFRCPDSGSAGECGGAAGLFRPRQTS